VEKIMAFKFKKAVIAGVGLMGGSLGLALRKYRLAKEVVGLGRNLKRLKIARLKGAADSVTTDIAAAVSGADLVIISLPVMMIPSMFRDIKPYLSAAAIVTDMGSVKGAIAGKISGFDSGNNYIGSHPMVGSEKAGVENIKKGLFEGGTCVVTPVNKTAKKNITKITSLWKSLKMRVIKMDPQEHDECMAGISHFPHLAAFAMVVAHEKEIKKCAPVIGPGFRDSTRIAASNEEIWAEIMLMNKKEVLKNIASYKKELDNLYGLLDNSRISELKEYIKRSKELRERL
jgi:prephenate dehydrogenase